MMERKKESSCIKVAFSITHTTDPIMILPGGLAVFQVNSHHLSHLAEVGSEHVVCGSYVCRSGLNT